MHMLNICSDVGPYKNQVLRQISEERLHWFAKAMQPFLVCIISDTSKDLIKKLCYFRDAPTDAGTPQGVTFRKTELLDLYVVINYTMQHVSRNSVLEARTIHSLSGHSPMGLQLEVIANTDEFKLTATGSALCATLSKAMSQKCSTFIICEPEYKGVS